MKRANGSNQKCSENGFEAKCDVSKGLATRNDKPYRGSRFLGYDAIAAIMTRLMTSRTGGIIPELRTIITHGISIGAFCHTQVAITSQYEDTKEANPTRIASSFIRFL